MPEPRRLRALICDGDVWMRRTLGTIASEAGFEVVGESANLIELLREVELAKPTLVVLTFDSMVMNPFSVLRELNPTNTGQRLVVLVTHDITTEQTVLDQNVYAVVPQGDTGALTRTLTVAARVLESGDDQPYTERRSGIDRRARQDWNKVTTQRRVSGRRKDDKEAS